MIHKRFLIVDSDGNGRVVTRINRRLASNEVAWRLTIDVPKGWAQLADQELRINMPPPPDAAPTLEVEA